MKHYRKMPYPELIKEHEQIVRVLGKSRSPAIKRLYHVQKKELAEYKQDYRRLRK